VCVCVCVCVVGFGGLGMWGTFSFASASTSIHARIFDITLEGNTIKGNYFLFCDTSIVEINLFVLVVSLRITHT
jgi:hypothetical protein